MLEYKVRDFCFSAEYEIEKLFGKVYFYKGERDIMSSSTEVIENKYGTRTTGLSKSSRSTRDMKKIENLIIRLDKLNRRLSKELNILRSAESVNKARKIESAKIIHCYPPFFYLRILYMKKMERKIPREVRDLKPRKKPLWNGTIYNATSKPGYIRPEEISSTLRKLAKIRIS
jgi:hypothetical protein